MAAQMSFTRLRPVWPSHSQVPTEAPRPPDEELFRSMWQEARDLIKRLEGSSVQRLVLEAGQDALVPRGQFRR